MPLHNTTVTAVRMPRLGRLAAIAAAAAAGAVTIAVTEDRPVPQVRTITESAQPANSRYLDVEANKAASCARSAGRSPRAHGHTSRYQDIEANKPRARAHAESGTPRIHPRGRRRRVQRGGGAR